MRHLLIDARCTRTAGTGIGNAAYRQIAGLEKLIASGEATGWKISVLRHASALQDESFRERWSRFDHLHFIDCAADSEAHPAGDIWQQLTLPRLLRQAGIDAIFSPAYVGPFRTGDTRRIIMIHDDLLWTQAASYPLKFRLYLRTMTRLSARSAHRIVYPSADARRRCDDLLGIDSARSGVVPNGIDLEVFEPAPLQGREPIAVCVASAERRKNHEVVLRALAKVPGLRLLFIGFSEKAKERLGELTALLPRERWDILPAAEESTVRDHLCRASLLVLPSRGEGFGLPVVEAMACGTPMVLSDIEVLREVAGECALYCDPDDAAGWAEAIKETLAGGSEVVRRREEGLRRVRGFSQENSARALLKEVEAALRQ